MQQGDNLVKWVRGTCFIIIPWEISATRKPKKPRLSQNVDLGGHGIKTIIYWF